MSRQNLLELDEITDRRPKTRLPPMPPIKSRRIPQSSPLQTATSSRRQQKYGGDDEGDSDSAIASILDETTPKAKPRPKPRSHHHRDIEDTEVTTRSRVILPSKNSSSASLSSPGRGDGHVSKSAYDNPTFYRDQGDDEGHRGHCKSSFQTPPGRDEGHHRGNRFKEITTDSEANMEGDEPEKDRNPKKASPSSRKRNKHKPPSDSRRGSISSQNVKQGQGGHVTVEIEKEVDKQPDVVEPPPTKSKPLGRIWQKLLSRGGSKKQSKQEQSIDIAEADPPITNPNDKDKSENKNKEKLEKVSKIDIESSSSEQDDDNPTPLSSRKKPPITRSPKSLFQKNKDKINISKPDSDYHPQRSRHSPPVQLKRSPNINVKRDSDSTNTDDDDEIMTIRDKTRPTSSSAKKSVVRTKARPQESSPPQRNKSPPPAEYDPALFFGIMIHSSDLLPLDANVLHPLVKVTLLTQDGKPVKKCDPYTVQKSSSSSPVSVPKKPKHYRGHVHEENVLPVMTQPFPFSFASADPKVIPAWEELLLFEEPYHKFLSQVGHDLIVFFEIMDFLPMSKVTGPTWHDGVHGHDVGWYKVAWGFLKPVGANGISNTDKMLRLQLFKPLAKLRKKEVLDGPEVYSWWKCGRREKLKNTTLYVTVKGICPPVPTTNSATSLRQLLSMRKENLTDAIIEAQLSKKDGERKRSGRKPKKTDPRKSTAWTRLEGQSCKVPNKLVAALPSSPIESLNLTISGNVHAVKFSPCGLKLAVGLDTEDLHAVLLFDIPTGNLLKSLKNHHGLIYDLAWKEVSGVEGSSYYQYLASASADSTVCIWSMKNNNETTLRMVKTLHHPSFVYTVQFHPTHDSLVVTGCFDFIIRIWDIARPTESVVPTGDKINSRRNNTTRDRWSVQTASPLFILDRHSSFVNCLTFDPTGSYLFSGDGDSLLFKWSIKSEKSLTRRKSWTIDREVKLTETGKIPINSLSLHPNGIRLLVHLRDNCLKILDANSLIVLKTVRGLSNDRLQIRSTFSPCGNLILSGNESTSFCIWDADTYTIADFITPKGHPSSVITCVDYHPRDFYVAVGLSSAISEPSPVLLYGYDSPKFSQIAMVQAGVAKFKSNLQHRRDVKPGHSVTFAKGAKRGDSSEKFASIIDKLDSALKDSQKMRKTIRSSSVDDLKATDQLQAKRPREKSPHTISLRSRVNSGTNSGHEKPTKSPRTYIEDRLEELILPSQKSTTTTVDIHSENGGQQDDDTEKVPTKIIQIDHDQDFLSPKKLPKTPVEQSSKIPTRVRSSEERSQTSNSVPSSPSSRTRGHMNPDDTRFLKELQNNTISKSD